MEWHAPAQHFRASPTPCYTQSRTYCTDPPIYSLSHSLAHSVTKDPKQKSKDPRIQGEGPLSAWSKSRAPGAHGVSGAAGAETKCSGCDSPFALADQCMAIE